LKIKVGVCEYVGSRDRGHFARRRFGEGRNGGNGVKKDIGCWTYRLKVKYFLVGVDPGLAHSQKRSQLLRNLGTNGTTISKHGTDHMESRMAKRKNTKLCAWSFIFFPFLLILVSEMLVIFRHHGKHPSLDEIFPKRVSLSRDLTFPFC
jgi:hypothetical protein